MTDDDAPVTMFQLDGSDITPKKSLINDFVEVVKCLGTSGEPSGVKATPAKRPLEVHYDCGNLGPDGGVLNKLRLRNSEQDASIITLKMQDASPDAWAKIFFEGDCYEVYCNFP